MQTCDFVVLCPFLSELLERSEEVVLFPRFFLLLACERENVSARSELTDHPQRRSK